MAELNDFFDFEQRAQTLSIIGEGGSKTAGMSTILKIADTWRTYHNDYFGGDCPTTRDAWQQVGGFFGLSFGQDHCMENQPFVVRELVDIDTIEPPINSEWGSLNGWINITQSVEGVITHMNYPGASWDNPAWEITDNLPYGPILVPRDFSVSISTKTTQEGNGGPVSNQVGVTFPTFNINVATGVKSGMDEDLFCFLFPDCCSGPGPQPDPKRPSFGFVDEFSERANNPPWKTFVPFSNYTFPIGTIKRGK